MVHINATITTATITTEVWLKHLRCIITDNMDRQTCQRQVALEVLTDYVVYNEPRCLTTVIKTSACAHQIDLIYNNN